MTAFSVLNGPTPGSYLVMQDNGFGRGLPPEGEGSVYHQFAVTHPRRDALAAHLAAAGIGTAVHYAPGLHRHPAFLEAAAGPLPVTEALSASLLSLPIQPEVAAGAPEAVARALAGFAS